MEALLGLLVLIAIALVYLARRTQRPRRETDLRAQLKSIPSMSGAEFERYMASVYKALGYNVTILGGAGDQGVDLLLRKGRESVAVQCKNHKRPVGNSPVQEVYAGKQHYGTNQAWVVAPAGFTKGAFALSRTTSVLLVGYSSIDKLLRQAQRQTEEQQAKEQRTPAKIVKPQGRRAQDVENQDGRRMDTTTKVALIVAATVVILAAMFLYAVVTSRNPPLDQSSKASRSTKVQAECEAAQTKLLNGEITDETERRDMAVYVARYCED